MSKVKVAVIGYGHLGKWHTQKADQLADSELVAIVEQFETNKKAAQEAYPHVKVVDSITDVMDEIDAAVVVTPTSTHFELVKQLLENKKHIFCEKPLCSSFEETQELKNNLCGKKLQVGHSERCHEIWEKLHNTFESIKNEKKTIKFSRFAAFKGRATDVDVVQDLMIHDIDLMLFLFGNKPSSVHSIGHKIRTDKWDHVTSTFKFSNGDQVIITSGRNHVKEERSLEVMGDFGCHFVDLFTNTYSFGTNTKLDNGEFVEETNYNKRDHLLIEQERFYQAILNDTDEMVTFEDGANAVYYVSKVLESLEGQTEIKL